jgi:hypothetical protein
MAAQVGRQFQGAWMTTSSGGAARRRAAAVGFTRVELVFQPLGDGHVKELPIQTNGSFNGELVSGEYAYYVAKPAAPETAASLKTLSPKYFEADLLRTITAEAGKQLAIALD